MSWLSSIFPPAKKPSLEVEEFNDSKVSNGTIILGFSLIATIAVLYFVFRPKGK